MSQKIGYEEYTKAKNFGFLGKENSKDGKDGKEGKDDICPIARQIQSMIEL